MIEPRRQTLLPPSSSQSTTIICLFLKLPIELRSEIYALVLGGQRFYLVYRGQFGSGQSPPLGVYWGKRLHHVKSKNRAERIRRSSHDRLGHIDIALLQSCRQIYAEAVVILYSSNVFILRRGNKYPFVIGTRALNNPSILVPPQYLSQIRRLEFQWWFKQLPTKADMVKEERGPGKNQITWTENWRIVAKEMPRLRILYVWIQVQEGMKWDVEEDMHWAAPMLKMGNLKTCKVFLRDIWSD